MEVINADITTWHTRDDDAGRIHIEVNGRKCASCSPVEAIAVIHVLQQELDNSNMGIVGAFEMPGHFSNEVN